MIPTKKVIKCLLFFQGDKMYIFLNMKKNEKKVVLSCVFLIKIDSQGNECIKLSNETTFLCTGIRFGML